MRTKFSKAYKYLRLVFYAAAIATVVFIFVNSALPPETSSQQSEAVSGIIAEIIPEDTPIGSFIIDNVRKIAHFTEYGLLGIIVSLYITVYKKKRALWGLGSLALSLVVAFSDESIQILSGRGPSVADMWIDIGGFATYSLLTYGSAVAIYYLVKLAVHLVKQGGNFKKNHNT